MTPLRNLLAAILLLLCTALAASAEVIPIIITNIVVQKIGPEAELEPLEEGLLYWRPADATTEAGLYYADGETPGGVAVCVGKADYHTLTNDLACNGHAIELNAHYSLRAEGDSCLLRYGTNIVLRVDGNREAGSTNSLIKATILSADNEGLTIQANALAADGATIEVTTDLMAVEAWNSATNAVVTDTTDVSTTWRITYLDEPYQFYRVFAGASTPHGTGITAERPFTASQGLAIPEGQGLTMGTNTWTNLPDMSTYASNSAVAAVRADLTSLSWRTTTAEGAIDANAAGIAAVQGAVATNAGNITTNSSRIAAIESDYVQAADIAAVTSAVASLRRLVEELERTDTCVLWWTDKTMKSGTTVDTYNWIPTNFPTPTLAILAVSSNSIHTISIPPDFCPDRHLTVRIRIRIVGSSTNNIRYGVNSVQSTTNSRNYVFDWDPAIRAWALLDSCTFSAVRDGFWQEGIGIPPNAPETVEEWIALHPEWTVEYTPAPAMMGHPSLQSLRPSLSSSAPLALDADPATLEDLAPEDFIDEDFTDPAPDALDDAEDDALPTLDEEA